MSSNENQSGARKRGPLLTVKTRLQNQLIWVVFAALAVPTVVLGGTLYLLLKQLTGPHATTSPHEAIVHALRYLGILYPLLTAVVLGLAFHRTNQIVGPIERIVRELDARLSGEKNGPITLRSGDQLIPLADKINALLQERDQFKNPPAQASRAAAAAA